MHAPLDNTVSIEEAEKIYREAKHPKSFVSLDDADHLLTRRAESRYIATESETATRPSVRRGHVRVEEKDLQFTQHVYSDSHHWFADEPQSVGGANSGPDPYEHLLAALGTCTAMTLRQYAKRKKLSLEHVTVEVRHDRDYAIDCEDCGDKPAQIEVLTREITLCGELSDSQRQRLLQIADRCPVHRTLHGRLEVHTSLAAKSAR